MADSPAPSLPAPAESAPTEASPDNSAPSLPDQAPDQGHQPQPDGDGDSGDYEGSGDEIADALAATADEWKEAEANEKAKKASDGQLDAEVTEAPSRVSEGGQSESRPKEDGAPATESTDRVKPSALATFHRQQREFFQAQQEFKAKEAEYSRVMGILENAKSDRLAALELMGYTDTKSFLESIAQDGGRETPERQQIRKLEAWKAQQERERQQQQQAQAQAHQNQAVQAKLDAIRADVQNTLKSESFSGGLLDLAGTDEQVMTEMDRMATETGVMPRVEDAIRNVEGKYRTYLAEMAANPEVAKFFAEKARGTASAPNGAAQSKQRARQTTIGSEARSPGTRATSRREGRDGEEDDLAEAVRFLNAQG